MALPVFYMRCEVILLYRVLLNYTAHHMGLFYVHLQRKSLPKYGYRGQLVSF